jgi:hypothetical protein
LSRLFLPAPKGPPLQCRSGSIDMSLAAKQTKNTSSIL